MVVLTMRRLFFLTGVCETFAVILLLCFTYLYPRPPIFTHDLADPKKGPDWFIKWRTNCDEHLFLNSMVLGYANPPSAEQISWANNRTKQIKTAFWLAYFEECVRNGPCFLGSGFLISLMMLRSQKWKPSQPQLPI